MKIKNTCPIPGKIVVTAFLVLFVLVALPSLASPQKTVRLKHLQNISKLNKTASLSAASRGYLSPVSVPGNSMEYDVDSLGGWQHITNTVYTYDAVQRIVKQVETEPITNDSLTKHTYTYDAQGNIAGNYVYLWQGGGWELTYGSFLNQLTYNAGNQITEQVFQVFDDSTGSFINYAKAEVTYNTDGNILEQVLSLWNNPGWIINARESYSYGPNNTINEIIIQNYVNGMYENSFKMSDVVWFDPAGFLPQSYVGEMWNGSSWENLERANITYDQYGGTVSTYEGYDNGTWLMEWRNSEIYDVHSNFTGFIEEIWNGTAWEIVYQIEQVLTYDGNLNITQIIYRDMSNFNNTLENTFRQVFSNFTTITNNVEAEEPVFTIYPNPAQNFLKIASKDAWPVAVSITDVSGRNILLQEINNDAEINLSTLQSGTYLIQISTKDTVTTSRFVKL